MPSEISFKRRGELYLFLVNWILIFSMTLLKVCYLDQKDHVVVKRILFNFQRTIIYKDLKPLSERSCSIESP